MENHSLGIELKQFEDQLWYFTQYARELQDHRDKITISWDDNAVEEINGRYLNPHAEDGVKLEENLKAQYLKLLEMINYFAQISQDFEKVNQISRRIELLLKSCEEDISKSISTMEISKIKRSDANITLMSATTALAKANAMK